MLRARRAQTCAREVLCSCVFLLGASAMQCYDKFVVEHVGGVSRAPLRVRAGARTGVTATVNIDTKTVAFGVIRTPSLSLL